MNDFKTNLRDNSQKQTHKSFDGELLGHNVRAVVLLAGQVRRTDFVAALQRSVMDLPIDSTTTAMDVWREQTNSLAIALGVERLAVRIMVNPQTVKPKVNGSLPGSRINMRVELDSGEYRGTGGVLRDIAEAYDDDDRIVVANGGQLMSEPLTETVSSLLRAGGDVSLISHTDGTPTGLMIIRCGVLRSISAVGFSDLKEQVLPRIATSRKVAVVDRSSPVAFPIRTRNDYFRALRWWHGSDDGAANPLAENWKPTYSIIEAGADVDSTARIHDSVVLRGGRVEAGASVVRSVVCEGGRVAKKQMATDCVVGSTRKGGRQE